MGAILNTDKMPKAWLSRFGRTVAEQVVDGVHARLEAPRSGGAQATLGGQALPSLSGGSIPAASGVDAEEEARRGAERLTRWLAGEDDEKGDESRSMTGREVLTQSAFSLNSHAEEGGPSVAVWGRGASSRFSGREGPLTVAGRGRVGDARRGLAIGTLACGRDDQAQPRRGQLRGRWRRGRGGEPGHRDLPVCGVRDERASYGLGARSATARAR